MRVVEIDQYRLHFTDSVLNLIDSYKQRNSRSPESGGILLGQVKDNDVYIMKASIPTTWDKATRRSFIRNKEIAQQIIDYEFANSGNRTIYLGEWHTHPEKYPHPSKVDEKMITDQYRMNDLNEPFLILFIQGINGMYIGLINKSGLHGMPIKTR